MAKPKAKTVETTMSVPGFVEMMEDKQRKEDCFTIIGIMKEMTGFEPKMWGPAIIGFGRYHYKYASGHEGDAPLIGFSPRKSEFALYIGNFDAKEKLLTKLGKHKTGKACVYIKKIGDIDVAILKELITGSILHYQSIKI